MSISQLHSPSRVTGLLEAARESVRAADAVPVGTVGIVELAEALPEVAALESQAAALWLALSVEAQARQAADDPDVGDGATGTDAWLAGLLGSTRATQAAGLRLAGLLKEKYAATREAYCGSDPRGPGAGDRQRCRAGGGR